MAATSKISVGSKRKGASTAPVDPDPLYTVHEAAELLGCKWRALYYRIRRGVIKPEPIINGRRMFIARSEIVRYWADFDIAECPEELKDEVKAAQRQHGISRLF